MNRPTRPRCIAFLLAVFFAAPIALPAQDVEYARGNTFTFLTQYSPTSGHILAGYAQDRQLFSLGVEYERKMYSNQSLSLTWLMQARPLMYWNDLELRGYRNPLGTAVPITPIRIATRDEAALVFPAAVAPGATPMFGHTRTFAGGVNPLGMKLNFGVHHRLQPMATGMFGFIIGSRDIPVDKSSAFNFVAEFGGGVEYFASQSRSIRLEYRFHHYSNAQLGTRNPGVDSGVFQASYSFGK